MRWKKIIGVVLPIFVLTLGVPGVVWADFITNGNFATTTGGTNGQTNGELNYAKSGTAFNLTGWTSTGYNFLFNSGNVTASTGESGSLTLWDKANSSNSPNNTWNGTAPGGNNFIGADGDYETGAISQNILNLSIGKMYTVGFWWAGAQQNVSSGASTDQWQVSLGSQTQTTSVYDNTGKGFSGWTYTTMIFTATATSETLSFLAVGTPTGVPPFSLLDGVSMVQGVPEPSSFVLVGMGLIGCVVISRRRRARTAIA